MAITGVSNYNSVYENTYASSRKEAAKKEETKETSSAQKNAENSKSKSTADYMKELAKLVPSVEFRVGNACVSDKSGKSLTVNPKLLEKMQNDPEKEMDMKGMIKGVESMSKLAESIAKATGWTIVYQHSYIDENGKYHCRMQTRNDGMLNLSDKLREERRKNSENLIEKTKEKAAEKKEALEEMLEEKKAVKPEEETEETAEDELAYKKVEQLIDEKMATSKEGMLYLNDTDFRTIMEAVREDGAGKTTVKEQTQIGANLDLQV